uniref:Uncharacterized protein n=1 Tax=Rhizophora mucronata TaxID=61149 RepID=A0A2P2R1J8_RHIMU
MPSFTLHINLIMSNSFHKANLVTCLFSSSILLSESTVCKNKI